MSDSKRPQILVTGANGQLGRLVVNKLLETLPPDQITAAVRNPDSVSDLAARGVDVRVADYDRPDTLEAAFAGIDRMLLVSSPDNTGARTRQQQNVIEAAVRAGVSRLAYTSILHADTSRLKLAKEHRETEVLLANADIDAVLLRNGWYVENLTRTIEPTLASGAHYGSARNGRFAAAACADYAAAAAAVLIADRPKPIYELAGDNAFTLADYAAEVARQSGQKVDYVDLPQADYEAALVHAGLPASLAALVADADAAAAEDQLFDDGGEMSRLIGRPTTSMQSVVAKALAGLALSDHKGDVAN